MNRQQRRRNQRKGDSPAKSNSAKWIWLAGGGLAGALIVVIAVLFAAGVFSDGDSGDLSQSEQDRLVSEGHLFGEPSAPVTLIEFADFQCPFCAQFWATNLQVIKREFIDTGKVKLYFHHMAFIGQESERAAQAAECAAEQNRFDDYHDILYQLQGPENQGYLSVGTLESFATTLQMDVPSFRSCLTSDKYLSEIRADTQSAGEAGINSTPTLVVDGNFVENALNIGLVRRAIQDAIDEAS